MTETKSELLAKINSDLMKAMKVRDEFRLSVLRMMKSKVLYVNARGELTDAEVIKIVSKYSKELTEAAVEANKVGRVQDASKSTRENEIVLEYLPKQLSPEEIKNTVIAAISELGATTIKDMGSVMKAVSAKHPGIDGKIVNQFVRELLK
ncbi:GatB/YqeY domain-containing protein [Candidatus Saganbacteria bacterium]|nr:GatB/YqeY domain-containing protein [Candidatus Saganbacteria bacterium]